MTLLTDIPDVGESIADELRDTGYETAESVGHANLLNLKAETENVNPEVVLEAKNFYTTNTRTGGIPGHMPIRPRKKRIAVSVRRNLHPCNRHCLVQQPAFQVYRKSNRNQSN